tara:strand:- start:45 stop:278 length:234 start_codon:yes stop_codon:yes gene_type:complete
MKKGDLVKPLNSCGGEPGQIRCETAIVVESRQNGPFTPENTWWMKAWCPCGTIEDYSWHFEKLGQVEPELAYSADPM